MIRPTLEWQVQGACNYDCSYCIQARKHRAGAPGPAEVERLLRFLAALPGTWEIKMSGGEPFAHPAFLERIVPGLAGETPHRISVLTNLSAGVSDLRRFARTAGDRLLIVSASLHLESTDEAPFLDRARVLRDAMPAGARLVVNSVLVPGRLGRIARAAEAVAAAGFKFFPQLMKTKTGVADYPPQERPLLERLLGRSPTPREANLAPSYRGRLCRAGIDYFTLAWNGDAWSCRTAKRHGEGRLGNAHDGSFRLRGTPGRCPYDICPCTVPANRGMVEGVDPDARPAEDAA